MKRKKPALSALEERLGYRFADKAKLELAITHMTAAKPRIKGGGHYQRLEFLGDHVLGLAISELLFREFPRAAEGELSRRLSALVRKETCAEVALALDLGAHLKLGASEAQSGGRKKLTILGDICESVIGAVFLDGGYEAARDMIERLWGERLHMSKKLLRDAKTMLQEWAQARALPPPIYRIVDRRGPDHKPEFLIRVELPGFKDAEGAGNSKRPRSKPRRPSCSRARAWCSKMPDAAEKTGPTRCGFVAIVGAPNVGKSTLVNALVGAKVSIVSPKVQTTRMRVRGIAVVGQSQIIFVDTPGIFAPRRRLDRAMVAAAWSGAGDADLVALVVDATRGLDEETVLIANRLGSAKAKKLLIINKIDLVKRDTAAGAGGRSERAHAVRAHVHGLREQGRRGRRRARLYRRRRCRGAVAVSGRRAFGSVRTA